MSEIRNLTRNGETFYPLTHENAVIGMNEFKETITNQVAQYKPIEITGDVVNAPDEEDITSDSNNLLKFKNRNNLYGLGKVILRRGSTFASQVTQSNTIYVIQYNFDLGNSRVNIPNGSILLFEGGSLSNGTLVCADLYDVRLVYYQDISVILDSVTLEGNFIHKACDKDTTGSISVDNSSIEVNGLGQLTVKAGGIQNTHLNGSVVDQEGLVLNSNNKISIKDGGVTGSKLNSAVVNTDDLSLVSNKIQLANRAYNQANPDGMGMIILRKDQSFASQLTQQNTIYVVRYNFTLTDNVTIPANCVLQFEGGSLSGNYTLTGQNTGVEAEAVKIFDTNITIDGTWNLIEVYPEWFGAIGNYTFDSTEAIKSAISFCDQHQRDFLPPSYTGYGSWLLNNTTAFIIKFKGLAYTISETIYIPYPLSIDFNNSQIIPSPSGTYFEEDGNKYMFICNVNAQTGNWEVLYPKSVQSFKNGRFGKFGQYISGMSILLTGAPVTMENIETYNIYQFYHTIGYNKTWRPSDSVYLDSIKIRKIFGTFESEIIPSDETKNIVIKKASYGDNLSITESWGDGKIHLYFTNSALFADNMGFSVRFSDCKAVNYVSCHNEVAGNVVVASSDVTISNSTFMVGARQDVYPILVQPSNGTISNPNSNKTSLTLNNVIFQLKQSTLLVNNSVADIGIYPNNNFYISFDNVYRQSNGWFENYDVLMTGFTFKDMLSETVYANKHSKGTIQTFYKNNAYQLQETGFAEIDRNDKVKYSDITISSSALSSSDSTLPTGTYKYKVWFVYNQDLSLGKTIETSSISIDSGEVAILKVNPLSIVGCSISVMRTNVSDGTTKYASIPVLYSGVIVDFGTNINGITWKDGSLSLGTLYNIGLYGKLAGDNANGYVIDNTSLNSIEDLGTSASNVALRPFGNPDKVLLKKGSKFFNYKTPLSYFFLSNKKYIKLTDKTYLEAGTQINIKVIIGAENSGVFDRMSCIEIRGVIAGWGTPVVATGYFYDGIRVVSNNGDIYIENTFSGGNTTYFIEYPGVENSYGNIDKLDTLTGTISGIAIKKVQIINTARPSSPSVGEQIFDTSLTPARPIYWNGTAWVDSTGNPV